MNKCEHAERISIFCASECCVWREAGGCEACMKKYHNHMGPTIFLSEEDIQGLVKKYTMDAHIKPKCRLLQEAIYNYFNLIKTEVTNSIDITCKNIINQIGYPFLYANNTLSTYKRLKNKEYKKLIQKEFRNLYELSQKIEQKDLGKEESKIYITQMKKTIDLLNQLEQIMKKYEEIIQSSHPAFQHDNNLIIRINDIVKSLKPQSPIKSSRGKQIQSPKYSLLSSTKQESVKSQIKEKQKDKDEEKKIIEDFKEFKEQKNLINQAGRQKDGRNVSLDKKIIKQHKFNYQEKNKRQDKQEKIKEEEITNLKFENLKKQLNHKQIQINEKKKILIDMMKNKQDSLKNSKEGSTIEKEQVRLKDRLDVPSIFQQLKSQKSMGGSKSSNHSSELDEDLNPINNPLVSNYAFTKLPVEEPKQRFTPQRQQVRKKLIVVPALPNLKQLNSQISQIDSPLLKKKNTLNLQIKLRQSKMLEKSEISNSRGTNVMPQIPILPQVKQQKKEDILQLKQNEQKSIALLLKSLTLKAQQAIPYLQSSLKFAQNNLSSAEYLTYLYLQMNRPKECLHLCNKILQKLEQSNDPEELSLNINNNKTAALNILGRYSQSIIILERCLRQKQKDSLYKNLGDAYFSISIYQKAIYNYEKALKLNDSYDEAHYNLAVCLYIQENYFNARLAIQKALEINPTHESYLDLSRNIEIKIGDV